jgi:D-3-phosphoglycerate dehydrogenase
LKVIAKHGAGVDNIDVKTASERGIAVLSAPGANSNAVADLTIGLFLALARAIPLADRAVRQGQWPRVVGVELSGKTLGIVGLGQIGKKVARRATGFGMRILAYDLVTDPEFARQLGIDYVSLDRLCEQAHFISVHAPLTASTRGLLGERELRRMRSDACLVNISRGGVVDEEALYRSLKDGQIRGAALDVFSTEPPRDSPLVALDNAICTPHMGGYTVEALRETGMICVRGILDVFEGRVPACAVNPEAIINPSGGTRR